MRKASRVEKLVFAVVLLTLSVVVLQACQPPTAPTPPTNVSQVVIVGPNNSGNGTGGTGSDAACAGITGTPALEVFSGTFNGGKGKVGEPLLLRMVGLSIPSSCTPQLNVNPSGGCVKLGSVHTVSQIILLPTTAGECHVEACVTGTTRCAANATQVTE